MCPEKTFTSSLLLPTTASACWTPTDQDWRRRILPVREGTWPPLHFLQGSASTKKLSLDPCDIWRRSPLSHTFFPPKYLFLLGFLDSFAFFGAPKWDCPDLTLPQTSHAYCKSFSCQTTYLKPVWLFKYYNKVRPDKATMRTITQHITLSDWMVTQQEHQSRA